jgi:hemerythrin-like domain-containing protein
MDMNIHEKACPAAAGTGCHDGGAGSGVHPVDVLAREHETIRIVLAAMAAEQDRLLDGGDVREAFWAVALEFLEHYADRCHHGKEEQLLFIELERAGLPAAHGPTACMRIEHETGRRGRQAMATALRDADGRRLALAVGAYVALLRDHIGKEDHVLFPMAKSLLDPAAITRLQAGFARVELIDLGAGAYEGYEQLARTLVPGQPPAPPR